MIRSDFLVIFPPPAGLLAQNPALMENTSRFNILRLRYKSAFDAYRAIVNRHAEVLSAGHALSDEQRLDEQRAAAELDSLRDELRAAGVARLDH